MTLSFAGGFGYDFSDPQTARLREAVRVVARGILSHGVTSFCPTLVTQSPDSFRQAIASVKRERIHDGATVLGSHLEGPFISREKRGAHPLSFVRSKPIDSFDEVTSVYGDDLSNVAIVTLAPELDPKDTVIRELVKKGVVVSVGHSSADLAVGERAAASGAHFITHLFNAMLPFHHRDPGLVGLLASDEPKTQIFYGAIADGLHTHYSALRIAFRANPDGLVLVTDTMAALGSPPGTQLRLGDQTVEVRADAAYIAGTETLCGSIAGMDQCCRNLRRFTGCSLVQAIECASLHPAQALGIANRKGSLAFGCDADFLLMDDDMNVKETWIAGRRLWSHDQSRSDVAS